MPKYADLTGQRFGKLLVVEKTGERYNGKILWRCKCDCGNEILVNTASLNNGNTKSCGCLRSEVNSSRMTDLVGYRSGMLVVVEKTEIRADWNTKKRPILWRCRCDCGNEILEAAPIILHGKAKSCGCLNRMQRADDMSGLRFGKLTVIRRASQSEKYTRNNDVCWVCRCDCGNECIRTTYSLRHGCISCGCSQKIHLDGDVSNNSADNIYIADKKVVRKMCTRGWATNNPTLIPLALQICELELQIETAEQSL